MNPIEMNLIELRNAIQARSLSAAEATEAFLERIEQLDGELGAFREVYAQRARARAKAVDAGQVTGELAGVPIAIKDNLCTAYGRTSCSSRMLENFQAPYTATAVRKLEEAGAVIVGKTNMDEFAMGSSCENSAFGLTRNPWDPQRVPGGSSGGSAAAAGARFAAASLGSDTGGSIRQPAALCGVVGLKPTYGAISRWGLIAFASSLDQIGPFSQTVGDAGLLLKVMAGQDKLDSTSVDVQWASDVAAVDEKPRALRIGIASQYMSDANEPAMARALEQAIAVYKAAGGEIVEVDLPHTQYAIPTYYIVATAEASSNLARYDGIHYGHRTDHARNMIDLYSRSRSEGFGDEVKRRIMLGTYALSSGYYDAYYLRALKARRLIKNDFDAAFEKCDAILCPTTTGPAFKLGEKQDDPLSMYLNDVYTASANLAGIPGLSMPAGFDEVEGKKLPLGLQLLGPAFGEDELLRIARCYEAATGYGAVLPGM